MPATISRLTQVALFVTAILSAGATPAGTVGATTPTKDAELYFNLPEFTAPAISPDGKAIAFIAQSEGHACLFKLDRSTGQIQGLFNPGRGDVKYFWWLGDRRVLLAGTDSGNTTTRYFVQDLGASKPRLLALLDNTPANWITIPPDDPDHIFALYYQHEGQVLKIDMVSGLSRLVEICPSDFEYSVVSPGGELRTKLWGADWKWHVAWRGHAKQPWHSLECSINDWPPFLPATLSADDRHIIGFTYESGDTWSVALLDPDTDQRTIIASRPDRDAYTLIWQAPQTTPVGALFYGTGPEDVTFFNETARQFSAALDSSLPGMLHRVTSSSKDGSVRIIAAWPPGYPERYFLFDQVQHRLSLLGEERPRIAPGALGKAHFFQYKTRDGLNESGYVIMPKQGPQTRPVPLLVMAIQQVGERAASANNFNAADQYFVSRGFAVAHFAVRGSAGYGHKFKQAGEFQLGGKIVEDFEDGVAYLAHEESIDPGHVALMGYGLGGLFALHTAARSKSFSSVVAYDTECNLTADSIRWMSSSIAETPAIVKQAGGSKAAKELLHEFELESFVAKITVPVLLVNSTWWGHNALPANAQKIRSTFDRFHKSFEWSQVDYHEADHLSPSVYQIGIYVRIADYLDKTLR